MPNQISSGMPPLSELCTAVSKAYPQNALGRLVVESIHRTLSHNVLLYRSATPLDVGLNRVMLQACLSSDKGMKISENGKHFSLIL